MSLNTWLRGLIARVLVRRGKRMAAIRLARGFSDMVGSVGEPEQSTPLVAAAHAWAAVGDEVRAEELLRLALAAIEKGESEEEKVRFLENTLGLLVDGRLHDLALIVWRARLDKARSAGRRDVLRTVDRGASLIARVDGGETLWDTFRAMADVEAWWSSGRR